MDEPIAVDTISNYSKVKSVIWSNDGSLTAFKKKYLKYIKRNGNDSYNSTNNLQRRKNDYTLSNREQAITRITVFSMLSLSSIAVAELIFGYYGSMAATSIGLTLILSIMFSSIAYLGVRIGNKPSDKMFHFGYHKIESFATLIVSIGMIGAASILSYTAFQNLFNQHAVEVPFIIVIMLFVTSIISLHITSKIKSIKSGYHDLSLPDNNTNILPLTLSSAIAFLSMTFSTWFGFAHTDAIGGLVIMGFLFYIAFLPIKRSFLTLIDSYHDIDLPEKIAKIIENEYSIIPILEIRNISESNKSKEPIIYKCPNSAMVKVREVLVRQMGFAAHAEIHLEMDEDIPLIYVEILLKEVKILLLSRLTNIKRITIIPHPISIKKSESSGNIARPILIKSKK